MAIYLIRHGETASNRARVVQTPDTPLSSRGLAQAGRLATRLADAGVRHVVTSDLARAHMTAAPIEQVTGAPLSIDADLQERCFGDLRGTSYAQLAEQGIELFAPGYAPPNGETWAAFHARVDRAWTRLCRIAESLDGHLAVVTHGLVCHSIASRLTEPPGELAPGSFGPDGPPIRFGNTALSRLTGPAPWRFELFACTAHLDGATAEDATAASGI